MSTQQLQQDTGYYFQRLASNAASLAFAAPFEAPATENTDLNAAVRINALLQTTLDTSTIIERFAEQLQSMVPHDGICYRNPAYQMEIAIGTQARHSCKYRLVVRDESLGELSLARKKKFTNRESVRVEYLLCGLVYPLRNALLYQNAVQAALKDPLTGCSNRTAMDTSLFREIQMARRHNTPFSMIMIDIDKFKAINDNYGHAVGDAVIKSVTDLVAHVIRNTDMLFRYGGEEFVVLLSNTTHEGAMMLAERIRSGIEKMGFCRQDHQIPVSASLGVATLAPDDSSQTLFDQADRALYRAKKDGRNCVRTVAQTSV